MKFLFIADPLEKVRPQSDTTLVLIQEAVKRGHEAFWATDRDVQLASSVVFVSAKKCVAAPKDVLPKLEEAEAIPLVEWDGVFIRKDPPFDESYLKLCWLLALEEKAVWISNKASVLIRYHEKLLPFEAVASGHLTHEDIIPTFLGNLKEAQRFVREQGMDKVIAKPFLGYAGGGLQLFEAKEFLQQSSGLEGSLIQPYQKAISEGDRRVFYLKGAIVGHFMRMPEKGGYISNLARGGTAVSKPITGNEKEVLEKLGKFLNECQIHFAGADVIGGRVSEVNITSPTGLRALEKLEGKHVGGAIIEMAETEIGRMK